jgi:competence protein ComEA helix-hairpin-helix repeat region
MDIIKKLLFITLFAIPAYLLAADTININTADKTELMSIKGVGEKRAEAIIAWREQNGLFKSVDELEAVSGIGPSIIDANRDNLTVGQ